MDKYLVGEVLKDRGDCAPKLSIPQQIEDMKKKGIAFELCSEAEAKRFLEKHNYYFKLKAYAHNYARYVGTQRKGQYVNVDFAYLKDLSTIDAHLRKAILCLSIDLEHFLKVQMLRNFNMVDEDGYEIIDELFRRDPDIKSQIENKKNTSTCHNIVDKINGRWAIWNVIELMSFGPFIELYKLFYERNKFPGIKTDLLYSVKMLRNAAAHNNCLINQMRPPYSREITPTYELKRRITALSSSKKDTVDKWLQHPTIHDFLALLVLYNDVVPEPTRSKGMQDIIELFSVRMPRNKDYYKKEQAITASYRFVNEIVQKILSPD